MLRVILLFAIAFVIGFMGFVEAGFAFSMAKADSSKPIEISADSLEVKRKENVAVFSGKVEAIQGNVNLRSDDMVVYYRQKDEEITTAKSDGEGGDAGAVSKIEVRGNVFLSTPEETAEGDEGVYDVDGKKVTLKHNVVVTKGENVVKGDNLVYNMATGESQVWTNKGKKGKGRVSGVFVPKQKDAE